MRLLNAREKNNVTVTRNDQVNQEPIDLGWLCGGGVVNKVDDTTMIKASRFVLVG
jgi:hypothetical protein